LSRIFATVVPSERQSGDQIQLSFEVAYECIIRYIVIVAFVLTGAVRLSAQQVLDLPVLSLSR